MIDVEIEEEYKCYDCPNRIEIWKRQNSIGWGCEEKNRREIMHIEKHNLNKYKPYAPFWCPCLTESEMKLIHTQREEWKEYLKQEEMIGIQMNPTRKKWVEDTKKCFKQVHPDNDYDDYLTKNKEWKS